MKYEIRLHETKRPDGSMDRAWEVVELHEVDGELIPNRDEDPGKVQFSTRQEAEAWVKAQGG